ncbi:MAG: putative serine protease [Chloroflexi bacterium OLB13]|nr:MAG: putative serine protease [Chloroflexi bacterium OLB13]
MLTSSKTARFFCLICTICALFLSVTAAGAQRHVRSTSACTLTPDQVLGQAFSGTAGAEGETGEAGLTPEGEDIVAEGLDASPEWIMEALPYAGLGTEPVAILVIDDFSSDGAGELPMSHGWLVWQVFEHLIGQLAPDTAALITLQQVNIADEAGYRSDLIVPELRTAVSELSERGIGRFVLNMSFVFIPCTDRELGFDFADFTNARRDNTRLSLVEHIGGDPDYVRSILEDARVGYIDESGLTSLDQESPRGSELLQSRLDPQDVEIPPTPERAVPEFRSRDLSVLKLFNNTALQSDPLRDYLREIRDVIIVPVASSGNFKQRQPFYPARWPEVISVSANEGDDLRFWLHSNNGDVSVPGAWFLFDDAVFRAGTSFAAPVVSLLIALDLTQTEPTCQSRGNVPALAHGAFDNTLLADAVGQFCGQ